jgi:hypothetical protein
MMQTVPLRMSGCCLITLELALKSVKVGNYSQLRIF